MRYAVVAAAFALAVSACGQGGFGGAPPIPDTPDGMEAPTKLQDIEAAPQAQLSDEEREAWHAQVRSYLDYAVDQYARGMNRVSGIEEALVGMQQGTDHRWYVELRAGVSYRFVGACDNDCDDMDFELIAPGGGVVTRDTGNARDDFPVANYTPTENGRYIARLLMMSCRVAPCFAGMRVVSADTAIAPPPG